jgi:hypothetical protein
MLHDLGEIRYKKYAHNVVEYLSVSKKSAQGDSTYLTSLIEAFWALHFENTDQNLVFLHTTSNRTPILALCFKNWDAMQNLYPRLTNYCYLKLFSFKLP